MENYELTKEMTPFQAESMVAADLGEKMVADLTSAQTTYCSMQPKTFEDRAKLFKAMNNPDKRIGDCINMTIDVVDVYAEVVSCTNTETGEVTQCPRIVLIDKDGVSYQAVSVGVFSALKKLFSVFGEPSAWAQPLPVAVKQVTRGERKMLTFDVKM